MLSLATLLKPASGEPIMGPNQDMVLGLLLADPHPPQRKRRRQNFWLPQEAILLMPQK
jgi:DNA-directed RNA polymerase beta' subunit